MRTVRWGRECGPAPRGLSARQPGRATRRHHLHRPLEQGAHIEAVEARLPLRFLPLTAPRKGSLRAGMQRSVGRAKTMTGTVAQVLARGLPGVVFCADRSLRLHTAITADHKRCADHKEHYRCRSKHQCPLLCSAGLVRWPVAWTPSGGHRYCTNGSRSSAAALTK